MEEWRSLTSTAISSSLFSCLVDHMMPDEITPRHYAFSHSIHVLSYFLSSIDLSFLSGQGLPLASDNVKYWCLVRCPPGSLQLLSACRYNCFGHYLMKLYYMVTFMFIKSHLTMFQHMHCLLVFRKMSFQIHFNFSLLAGIIS